MITTIRDAMASHVLLAQSLETRNKTCFAILPEVKDGGRSVVRVFNLTDTEVLGKHFPPGTHIDTCRHQLETPEQWVMFLPTLIKESEAYDADHHIHLCMTSKSVDPRLVERAMEHKTGKHTIVFLTPEELRVDKSYKVFSRGLWVPHTDSHKIRIYNYGCYNPLCLTSMPSEEGTFYPTVSLTSHSRLTIVVDGEAPHMLGYVDETGALVNIESEQVRTSYRHLTDKFWFPVLLGILRTFEDTVKGTHETLSPEDYAILEGLSEKGRTLLQVDHYKPSDDGTRRAAKEFQEFMLSLSFEGQAKVDFDNFCRSTNFLSRTRNLFEASMAPPIGHMYRQVSGGELFS